MHYLVPQSIHELWARYSFLPLKNLFHFHVHHMMSNVDHWKRVKILPILQFFYCSRIIWNLMRMNMLSLHIIRFLDCDINPTISSQKVKETKTWVGSEDHPNQCVQGSV